MLDLADIDTESQLNLNSQSTRNAASAIAVATLGAAAALSLIPFESNFGSELAGRGLHQAVSPFISRGISEPIDDALKVFLRYGGVNPRMLLAMVESGVIADSDLIESGVLADLKDREIAKVLALARFKRYEASIKEDMARVKQYETALVTEQIEHGKAVLREQIQEKRDDIRDLQAFIRQERSSYKFALQTKQINQADARALLEDLGLTPQEVAADIRAALIRGKRLTAGA